MSVSVGVKLFIDKEKQRVLFAESDKDFVDVLFSFLTLPLGTIVRLLGKQSGVGCLDEVYKSVDSLSIEHFQAEACKTMLLEPLNAAAGQCDRLKMKVGNRNPRSIYVCSSETCNATVFSSVRDAICKGYYCKGRHDKHIELPLDNDVVVGFDTDGVFVKSGPKLIITDDLQVAPASTCLVFSLLDKFGLNEKADIEEKFLNLDYLKTISLLKSTLISKEPLTDIYFDTVATPDDFNLNELPANMFPKEESDDAQKLSVIKIKLIQTADNSAVLYAEVGQDFVVLIFGLLTFPVGSIIKSYGQWPTNGCVDNLYLSVEGSARECTIEDYRSLPVSPKLAPFFGCSINALQVEESDPKTVSKHLCCRCFKFGIRSKCKCYDLRQYNEINPKSTSGERDTSRGYVKGGLRNFIVTNDLRILEFSLANTLQVMRASNIPKEKLVEKELSLDRTQVLKILRAAIATREALSSVLLPPKKKRHPHH